MIFEEASLEQLPIIRELAYKIWPDTYGATHTSEELDYMLGQFYAIPSLEQQRQQGHVFVLVREGAEYVGFVSYELHAEQSLATKIHKLYVLPDVQGKGVGKSLITHVINQAKANKNTSVFLNVNKHNSAIEFYKKNGFEITKDIVIDIGNGYVMDDYVMKLML